MYTLEQLQAKTDEELVTLVAEEVMGWSRNGGFWHQEKPHSADFVAETFYACGEKQIAWNPVSGSWDDTMQVVKKIVLEDCERFRLSDYKVSCGWEVNIGEYGWCVDFNAQRAICIASLLAL